MDKRVLILVNLTWMCLGLCYGTCYAAISMLTEDAAIIRQGEMAIELGFGYFKLEDIPRGELDADHASDISVYETEISKDHFRAPTIGIRVGLSRYAEFFVDWPAYIIQKDPVQGTEQDFGDVRIYTKLRLVAEGKRFPVTSFQVGTKLPNTSDESGLGTDETDFFVSLLLSKWVGQWTIHVNGGMAILGNPDFKSRQKDTLIYSAGVVYHTLQTNIFLEVNKGLGIIPFKTPTTVRGGIMYKIVSWTFDLGFSSTIDGLGEDYGVIGGLTYSFRLFD